MLAEDDLGHPEIGDAIVQSREVLDYNVIGGKYQRGMTVLITLQDLVETRKLGADSLQ